MMVLAWIVIAVCLRVIFVYTISSTFINQNPTVRKSCPFSTLLITHSIIYIKLDSYIFYSMEYNPLLSFCCSNHPSFHHVEIFQVSYILQHVPISSEYFLTFWHHEMFQINLTFSLAQSWSQPTLQEHWLLLLENGI